MDRVYCRDCPRYDSEAERCRDGKLNPLGWETAVSVSRQFGVRAICMFNDHRERLIHARSGGGEGEAGGTRREAGENGQRTRTRWPAHLFELRD